MALSHHWHHSGDTMGHLCIRAMLHGQSAIDVSKTEGIQGPRESEVDSLLSYLLRAGSFTHDMPWRCYHQVDVVGSQEESRLSTGEAALVVPPNLIPKGPKISHGRVNHATIGRKLGGTALGTGNVTLRGTR